MNEEIKKFLEKADHALGARVEGLMRPSRWPKLTVKRDCALRQPRNSDVKRISGSAET